MEFFAVNGKRPVRLNEKTRQFAYDSLAFRYGLDTKRNPAVSMDDIADFEQLTSLGKYDRMISRIAEQSPIRICEGERISGAATLGMAIGHTVPATYEGKTVWSSISHLTIDFETVLKKGICELERQARESFALYKGTEKEPFLQSCLNCLDAFRHWHGRYLAALKDMPAYQMNYQILQKVPFQPAESFYEAVQGLWFTFAFVRLCGNWPGIGRIDWLLGDYLKKDLETGALTLEEARDILAHFFIKGCEWVSGGDYGSGDAQHYQNIVLSGVDENGVEVTNEVTYLVLDIIEELGISDFPVTVRLNKNSPAKLLTRVAEVIRYGGGVIAVYNEDLILDALTEYGYALREARKFANDGCWEVQIPGKTYFIYGAFDGLQLLQNDVLDSYNEEKNFESYDLLFEAYLQVLRKTVCGFADAQRALFEETCAGTTDWKWKPSAPCTVVSLFEQGCIEKGLSYLEGGPVYNVKSLHFGGLPDAVNSLYAIKKLVFDEQKVSFRELMQILKNNWEGAEPLRRYALNQYQYFGNDNDEVDFIARDIIDAYAGFCNEQEGTCGYRFPAGVSTFGRQIEWSPYRFATPYGKKAKEILAGNFSPTPGTDKEGATAIIKSYCKTNLKKTVNGAALDIKFLPSVVNNEHGLDAIISLLKGFVTLGGFFMQLDIADTALLKAAQEKPEDYQTLSVRVSGWNARFVTLNKQWQDMIIAQTGSDF